MLDGQRTLVARLDQRRHVRRPIDHAEAGDPKAIGTTPEPVALAAEDAVAVEPCGQELRVLRVRMVDAVAKLAHGPQVVDPEPHEVRWVEAETHGGAGQRVEDRFPPGRSVGEILTIGRPVLQYQPHRLALGVRRYGGTAFRKQADVLVKRELRRHSVSDQYGGDALGGRVVNGRRALRHLRAARARFAGDRLKRRSGGGRRLKVVAATDARRVRLEQRNVDGVVAVFRAPTHEVLKVDRREMPIVEVAQFHEVLAPAAMRRPLWLSCSPDGRAASTIIQVAYAGAH